MLFFDNMTSSIILVSFKYKKMMIYRFFLLAEFSLDLKRLLQSHFSTHMLYNSWNSGIVSDILSALSKKAERNHESQFIQFAADLAIFGKLLQSLKVAAGQRNFVQRLIDTLRGTI